MNILHIALESPGQPNGIMSTALRSFACQFHKIIWNQTNNLQEKIKSAMNETKFDLVFMQLQNGDVINNELAGWMKERAFVINWTGDVRENIDWYFKLAPDVSLTLFTNTTDVEKTRTLNLQSDYLQVGYDNTIYKKDECRTVDVPEIVFLGNNYGEQFPLSSQRKEMVSFLKNTYGSRFQVYGEGWNEKFANIKEEVSIYNNCKIAINQNHFNHKRFSSDRLFRIMGCGAFCLSNYFPDAELEFNNGQNIIFWNDFEELKKHINYFLIEETERKRISENGYILATTTATWEKRFLQMFELIKKYNNHS